MNPPHKFFISHFNNDRDIAELLASLLSKVTLDQISPWYSSDSTGKGGVNPGKLWFTEIIDKIEKSAALVALVTPNSISRPWLYFESGIAQSLKTCDIIPVCVGISKDNVYAPLGQYQCFQLSDYRSLREFIDKLLNKFNVKFDEEICKPFLEKTIKELSQKQFVNIEEDPKIRELLLDLKSHIDKRFIEIWERPNIQIVGSKLEAQNINIESISQEPQPSSYTIAIKINLPQFQSDQIIEIRENDMCTDIIKTIYFLISDYIPPYTYLEEWMIRDKKSDKNIIIREIGDLIPAKYIFHPSLDLEVIKLSRPYNAIDSSIKIKDNEI